MTPQEIYIPVPGGRIFTLQWGEGPLLVFTHATGMNARLYVDLLGPLCANYRIVAYDARGHGRTELQADPDNVPFDWLIYQQDLKALCDALGGGPFRLAGHSFGASTSFETAVRNPGLATSVLLIDPPFIPSDMTENFRQARVDVARADPMSDQAKRRRAVFPSKEFAKESYRGRGVFQGWPEKALDDYLEGGLLPHPDGVRLACDPLWEAASYKGVTTTLVDSMRSTDIPFQFLAAEHGSTVPLKEEALFRELHPNAFIHRFPGTGHFLPVTHADLVRPFFLNMV